MADTVGRSVPEALRRGLTFWRRSIQARVVVSTVLLSTVVLVAVGWFLLRQVRAGPRRPPGRRRCSPRCPTRTGRPSRRPFQVRPSPKPTPRRPCRPAACSSPHDLLQRPGARVQRGHGRPRQGRHRPSTSGASRPATRHSSSGACGARWSDRFDDSDPDRLDLHQHPDPRPDPSGQGQSAAPRRSWSAPR